MVFKFYKTETVKLPDGNEFEVVPITVEDMPLVLEIIDVQKQLEKDALERLENPEDASQFDEIEKQVKTFFPLAWKIAQRGVKRTMEEHQGKGIEALDKAPDIPMSINVAVEICTTMINVSMTGEGVDIKNPPVSRKRKKKS